jgi:putative ABC transport system permease protein
VDDALGTTPWLRAPLLLLGRPAVFLAILAATAVLSIAASSGVLFVSTLATASLHAQAADDCPELSMPQLAITPRADRLVAANQAMVDALRPIDRAAYTVDITRVVVESSGVTLFARPGVLDHVHKPTPDHGRSGVWVPASMAEGLGVAPGDRLTSSDGRTLPIAGIYKDLSNGPLSLTPLPRYWCTWKRLILQRVSDEATPPLLLTDAATIGRYAAASKSENPADAYSTYVFGYAPIPVSHIAVDTAERANQRALTTRRELASSLPELAPFADLAPPQIDPLDDKLVAAHHVQKGLTGSVLPIDLAGALVALLLVAGAGGFWATHRAREIRLLTSRGVAPRHLGVKAVLETAPAAVAGLVLGVFSAKLLVETIGPARQFPDGTVGRAIAAASAAVAVGLALIGVIGTLAAGDRDDRGAPRRRHIWRHVPWELALLGVTAWLAVDLQSNSGVNVDHTIVTVRSALVLFPIVGAAAALVLVARSGWFALPQLAKVADRLPRAGYLAARRMSRSRAIAVALLVGTALPVALLTYASTISTGVRHEITRKYQTNLGAPQVLNLLGVHYAKPDLRGHGTAVVTYPPADGRLSANEQVAVLGIDPVTFNRFAYTTAGQRRAVDLLRDGGPRAILVNAPSRVRPRAITISQTRLSVRIVARSAVFPGLRSGAHPMLVVNRDALADIDVLANRGNQAWTTTAELGALSQLIDKDNYTVIGAVDPTMLVGQTGLLPVSWILGYLSALAVLIGGVAAAGLVFALGARTRQRTVSYVMSRKMGLRQGTHVRSLLIEMGVIVGLGWGAGVAAGTVGFAFIVGAIDVYPALPPGAEFRLSPFILLGTALGALVAIAVAVIATHHFAERADPADILRLE